MANAKKVNVGKIFENDFKSSFSDNCLVIRLPDPPQAFTQRDDTKFSHKNPCDYIVFNTINKILYCLELKTTKGRSISFEDINGNGEQKRMIHKHQIEALEKFSKFDNVKAAFVFNFRDDKNGTQRTYYQDINDFQNMCANISKVSFDEIDLIKHNAKKINGVKKRVHFRWEMEELFAEQQINIKE